MVQQVYKFFNDRQLMFCSAFIVQTVALKSLHTLYSRYLSTNVRREFLIDDIMCLIPITRHA